MRPHIRPRWVFDILWDVYRTARFEIDDKGGLRALDVTDSRKDSRQFRPRVRPCLVDFSADFALAGEHALRNPHLASRLILFRVYYLGLAPYEHARHFVGISELTWAAWSEQIRDSVGSELMRRAMFPPRRYFQEPFYSAIAPKGGWREYWSDAGAI